MSSIAENIKQILTEIPPHVQLVAVSKTKPNEALLEAYQAQQRHFGENKVQEMVAKWEALPKDIKWHFIGHLQSNKVKYMAPFVHLIHGVDSLKLLAEINKQAIKANRTIGCLLQFHIAKEETKFGFDFEEATSMLNSDAYKSLQNIRIEGVMGMATFTENEEVIASEFATLKQYFDELKVQYFYRQSAFNIISMGMSNDYQLAIAHGSNMIRIGSSLFGARN